MKNNEEIIKILNYGLACEFNAIAQYTCHSEIYKDLGYADMGKFFYKETKEERKHAQLYLERITYLNGKIDINESLHVDLGNTIETMLKSDLAYEKDTVNFLRKAIETAESAEDYGSSDLFRTILKDEEKHEDLIETLLSRYYELGEKHYVLYFASHYAKH